MKLVLFQERDESVCSNSILCKCHGAAYWQNGKLRMGVFLACCCGQCDFPASTCYVAIRRGILLGITFHPLLYLLRQMGWGIYGGDTEVELFKSVSNIFIFLSLLRRKYSFRIVRVFFKMFPVLRYGRKGKMNKWKKKIYTYIIKGDCFE